MEAPRRPQDAQEDYYAETLRDNVDDLTLATSELDRSSLDFTEAISEHSHNPSSFTRVLHIKQVEQEYGAAFSQFASTVEQDPTMDKSAKLMVIATTILAEEGIRLAHIESLLKLKPGSIERTELLDICRQILVFRRQPTANDSFVDSLRSLFEFIARADVSVYMQNVPRR